MDKSKLGIVLKFKKANKEKDLAIEANHALNQIYDKQYESELNSLGINSLYNGDQCSMRYLELKQP